MVRLGSQNVQNVVIYTTIISIENPRRELLPGMTANLRIETERRDDVVRIPNAALRWRPADQQTVAAPGPGGPGGPPAGGGEQRRPQGGGSSEFIDAIKKEIQLSSVQTKDIDALVAETRQQMIANATSGGDANSRRERFRLARQALEKQISGILTDDQKPVFEKIRARFAEVQGGRGTQSGRVFVVGADGKPEGVTIRIGATDGAMTEIVSGLQPGVEVIVGGGAKGGAARPGPRFGF